MGRAGCDLSFAARIVARADERKQAAKCGACLALSCPARGSVARLNGSLTSTTFSGVYGHFRFEPPRLTIAEPAKLPCEVPSCITIVRTNTLPIAPDSIRNATRIVGGQGGIPREFGRLGQLDG